MLFVVLQGDAASQNMMRSIARQVCEQLVNSKFTTHTHTYTRLQMSANSNSTLMMSCRRSDEQSQHDAQPNSLRIHQQQSWTTWSCWPPWKPRSPWRAGTAWSDWVPWKLWFTRKPRRKRCVSFETLMLWCHQDTMSESLCPFSIYSLYHLALMSVSPKAIRFLFRRLSELDVFPLRLLGLPGEKGERGSPGNSVRGQRGLTGPPGMTVVFSFPLSTRQSGPNINTGKVSSFEGHVGRLCVSPKKVADSSSETQIYPCITEAFI